MDSVIIDGRGSSQLSVGDRIEDIPGRCTKVVSADILEELLGQDLHGNRRVLQGGIQSSPREGVGGNIATVTYGRYLKRGQIKNFPFTILVLGTQVKPS